MIPSATCISLYSRAVAYEKKWSMGTAGCVITQGATWGRFLCCILFRLCNTRTVPMLHKNRPHVAPFDYTVNCNSLFSSCVTYNKSRESRLILIPCQMSTLLYRNQPLISDSRAPGQASYLSLSSAGWWCFARSHPTSW